VKFFAELRVLGFLRRICRALEEANDLERQRIALEFPAWAKTKGIAARAPKLTEFGVADPKEWNARWDQEQENPSS